MKDDLFVGITTWESELFLEACLRSVWRCTEGVRLRVGVVDNVSRDRSVEIARDLGARVHVEHCSQAIALNRLLAMSEARHTLLLHSDVVLLSARWYPTCSRHLSGSVALVSPEDVGCGPLTRPYGAGMPESCFLLFDTQKARKCRTVAWVSTRGIPIPTLRLDLEHYYVTHDLPAALGRRGFTWKAMRVHASPKDTARCYEPPFTPEYWSEELSYLRYAMGNFYSLDGEVTHYHNWFDRVPKDVPAGSLETSEGDGRGLPLEFLTLGTRRFLEDLAAGAIVTPSPDEPQRTPMQTPRHVPDLARGFGAPAGEK
ncbi:MAG: glycosyltransferase [Thermoanaerobaculia bacterium]